MVKKDVSGTYLSPLIRTIILQAGSCIAGSYQRHKVSWDNELGYGVDDGDEESIM